MKIDQSICDATNEKRDNNEKLISLSSIPSTHFLDIYATCPWLITNINNYARNPSSMMLKEMIEHDLEILRRSTPNATYLWFKHIIDAIEAVNFND